MGRTLHRRVEVAFPVRDRRLKSRVFREAISVHLRDNAAAWEMDSDGAYKKVEPRGARLVVSQQELLRRLSAR
jgi:polyphosphate kinase